jgi:sialate O-acetylesterase
MQLRSALRQITLAVGLCLSPAASLLADVSVPNIFGDHMVLQREQKNRVWGKAGAGEKVTVKIGPQSHSTTAGGDGLWKVELDPLPAGGPHEMSIKGNNEIKISDILIGEVWICSGQSNMQWTVNAANDPDLEKLAAHNPNLRMINFPRIGSQEPLWEHKDSSWKLTTPDTVGEFSAVGYFFGRQIQQTIDVPVGLINNAWGGSHCEAWINREILKADSRFQPLMDSWTKAEAEFTALSSRQDLNDSEKARLKALQNLMGGNSRPSNIYNGVLKSHLGYGIRGAIWYQGESNADRAYQYRDLFPLMIETWRKEWGQGDFPFYWVQLADFKPEQAQPVESDWAELREAQTMTMARLPNTGEAVIVDIGEGKDIHPKNKVDVGRRLARWALANEYKVKIPFHSPQFKSMEKVDGKIVLTFDHVGGGWRPFDVAEPRGFAIAGEDKKFVWAKAEIRKEDGKVVVSHPDVPNPVAVRYAWADNPVCNMFSSNGLPLTPFRTDDWPGVTANNKERKL